MKVDAGLISLTGVPDGRHREYLAWARLEKMPELDSVEEVRLTQSWVSTPELVDRRLYAGAEVAAGRYLNLSLLAEPVEEALDGLESVNAKRAAEGRSFAGERTYLRGAFDLVKTYAAPSASVDADAVPFLLNLGVFITAQDHAPGATRAALDEALRWYDEVHIPDLLGVRGVVGCWWFEASGTNRGPYVNPRGRTIRVYWLDEDPIAFHDDLAAKTPGMQMMDLRPAYRTLIVGSYRAIPWPWPAGAIDG
jgi:hypothetical protein